MSGISPMNNFNMTPYNSGIIRNGEDEKAVAGMPNHGKTQDGFTTQEQVKKANGEECQTCKNRKYKDGSNEMVSFKSPTHISPEGAAAAVRSHEQEHVTNAYSKAANGNGKVISASVAIHTAICPECGRSYVSGGTTSTQIKYYNENNPYQQQLKNTDAIKYTGMNLDIAG